MGAATASGDVGDRTARVSGCADEGARPARASCICDVKRNVAISSVRLSAIAAVRRRAAHVALCALLLSIGTCSGYDSEFDKSDQLVDKVNLDQIAAVFNKVAYGSTTKRSIPDSAYPVTTLATPLLTTYRYSDGYEEWLSVDVKKNQEANRGNPSFEPDGDRDDSYGADLEKDHTLPTSAPAADILKNNNNRHYSNPNRYNNDRLKPDYQPNNPHSHHDHVTENSHKATTYLPHRNTRPTKPIYSKDIPSYVPPSREFFTPPLPPQYQNHFLDKPTLRGTNNDYIHRRPIPPPSLMPNKERIPFRPDLPKVNSERQPEKAPAPEPTKPNPDQGFMPERKKTLNTPSQQSGGSHFDHIDDGGFEYDKGYIPAITRILSGPNGRQDEFPDLLFQTVPSATPFIPGVKHENHDVKEKKTRAPVVIDTVRRDEEDEDDVKDMEQEQRKDNPAINQDNGSDNGEVAVPPNRPQSVFTVQKTAPSTKMDKKPYENEPTTESNDLENLRNNKERQQRNVTFVNSDEIWVVCWNVHICLVVIGYCILAAYSIYKLIRYENEPHMFSKSYFLTIHLMLTVICVLRIFYLTYDAYNVGSSFNVLSYDFLHNIPLSLMATTFAILILFLLKRTLTHLEVKTRPVFLVVLALLHICLCLGLSVLEQFGQTERTGLIVCRPVFVLLTWALGFSYLYLYRIIKNVLAKKSQNLSEMCTQNISYASHITIAVALLFILLGFVQLYSLFYIEVDRFNAGIKHHWILWGYEFSVRVIEISILTLLAIVVSLRMSQREKQTNGGFPLFPCTTSDSSTDNIYPNNCNTNPNATSYSRNELMMDGVPTDTIERPILVKNQLQANVTDNFDKKSTLERYHSDNESRANFDRIERPKWGSDRFDPRHQVNNEHGLNNFLQAQHAEKWGHSGSFDRTNPQNSSRNAEPQQPRAGSGRRAYDTAKYYVKPKYDVEFENDDYQQDNSGFHDRNIYSEPIDTNSLNRHHYERTRHEFERSDFDRRSRNSSNTSGRRSTGRARKNHPRPHLGIQTLPSHEVRHHQPSPQDSMLVDEQGFVRFRHMNDDSTAAIHDSGRGKRAKKNDHYHVDA